MADTLEARVQTVVVFDVETTGLNCAKNEIIEFGAVKAALSDLSAEREQSDFLIRLPEGVPLPADITRLTGITEDALQAEGISQADACERIVRFLDADNLLLAAYNAQFDLCFLYYFLKRFGKEDILRRIAFLDILTVYRDRRAFPHKLSDAVAAYRVKTANTHRAIDDARAALELLHLMEQEENDLHHYVNLFGFHPKYGVSGPKISTITYRAQSLDASGRLYR